MHQHLELFFFAAEYLSLQVAFDFFFKLQTPSPPLQFPHTNGSLSRRGVISPVTYFFQELIWVFCLRKEILIDCAPGSFSSPPSGVTSCCPAHPKHAPATRTRVYESLQRPSAPATTPARQTQIPHTAFVQLFSKLSSISHNTGECCYFFNPLPNFSLYSIHLQGRGIKKISQPSQNKVLLAGKLHRFGHPDFPQTKPQN